MNGKISISLPASLEEFARWRVRYGGYGSISEYFRELIRIDQRYQLEAAERRKEDQSRPLASATGRPAFNRRY